MFRVAKAQDESDKQCAGNQPAGAGCMSIDRMSEVAAARADFDTGATRDCSGRTSSFPHHTTTSADHLTLSSRRRNPRRKILGFGTDQTLAVAGELFRRCHDRARADRVGAIRVGTPGFSQFALAPFIYR